MGGNDDTSCGNSAAFQGQRLAVLLYADDTLLMGHAATFVQQLLDVGATIGIGLIYK